MTDEQVASAPTLRQPDGEERLAPGTMAGEYRVEAHVGAGAMGDVYRAVQPQIGKRVAVKVIKRRLAGSEEAVERFIREARLVNKIDHPNVVDVFALGRLPDGRLFLVMDFLEGESLGRRLRRDGCLPVPELVTILRPVCEALAAAHARNVVHRDLKSDNIFLAGERVYVLDFGIAKLLAEAAAETSAGQALTREGQWIGTPAYMAPEQWTAEGANVASDVYALGVVAYEILAGNPPFLAPSVPAIMEKHFRAQPPALSTLGAGRVPPAVEAAIRHALAKKAEDRPAGVLAFLDELERAVGGAGPLSLRGARPRPIRRRVSSTVAALAAAVVACALAAALFLSRRKDPDTDPPIGGTQVLVALRSVPPQAEVRQGDKPVGRTPFELSTPRGETVTLVFERKGFAAAERTVTPTQDTLVEVKLEPVRGFEGIWRIPGGELRKFQRSGDDYVIGYALSAPEGEPRLLRNYTFLPAPGGTVIFSGSHEHVDRRAPSEPSCHIPVEMQYRYQSAGDKLELRKQEADYGFSGGRCLLQGDPRWGEFEPAIRIAGADALTHIVAPGAAPRPEDPNALEQRKLEEQKKAPNRKAPKKVQPPPAKSQSPAHKGELDAPSPLPQNAAPPPAQPAPEQANQAPSLAPSQAPQQAKPFTGAKVPGK